MKASDFYYELPQELIAQHPIKNRSDSRLLCLDKTTGEITHNHFKNIVDYLKKGDCLVLNDTRVIPARLHGIHATTGSAIEFLLLNRLSDNQWEILVKPGKRAKTGAEFIFGDTNLYAKIVDVKSDGNRIVEFEYNGIFEEILDKLGEMPLPPYITEKLDDNERYQTVYSKNNGSAAAPTAGLHFTPELLEEIAEKGVEIAYITLHVGLGTFRPVKVENIEEHQMHSEFYVIDEENAAKINNAKQDGRRIISVGTTSTRTLESLAQSGEVQAASGWTDIFIYPPYQFKVIDALITNFHLPESTLIMLISAFAGKDNVFNAYSTAIQEKYRFFSFGDAMLIY